MLGTLRSSSDVGHGARLVVAQRSDRVVAVQRVHKVHFAQLRQAREVGDLAEAADLVAGEVDLLLQSRAKGRGQRSAHAPACCHGAPGGVAHQLLEVIERVLDHLDLVRRHPQDAQIAERRQRLAANVAYFVVVDPKLLKVDQIFEVLHFLNLVRVPAIDKAARALDGHRGRAWDGNCTLQRRTGRVSSG